MQLAERPSIGRTVFFQLLTINIQNVDQFQDFNFKIQDHNWNAAMENFGSQEWIRCSYYAL